jgi:methenyltetrahydrofolate cyclohydrolase
MAALRDISIGAYLERVSAADPTPGGGSVASLVAALSASLGAMVTAITASKGTDAHLDALSEAYASFRETFLQLGTEDEHAFEHVMTALRLPKGSPERAARLEASLRTAAEIPLKTARACVDVLASLETLAPSASRHTVSDIGVAAYLAVAALRSCLLTVHINRSFMTNEDAVRALGDEAEATERVGQALGQRITDLVKARI